MLVYFSYADPHPTPPFFFTINVLLHRTTQKKCNNHFVVTFFSKRKGSPVLGDH